MIAEAEALDFGEEVVAELKGDVLGKHLRHVHLREGEGATSDGEEDDDQPGHHKRAGRILQVESQVGQVQPQSLGGHRLQLFGQVEYRLTGGVGDDRVDDPLDQLGHRELGAGGDQQREDGDERNPRIAKDVLDSAAERAPAHVGWGAVGSSLHGSSLLF